MSAQGTLTLRLRTALAQCFGSNTRVGRGLWSGIDAGASPLAALLTTAGLVRALGPQHFGVLVVVLAVSGLSTAISPAIATTTTRFIAEAVGLKASLEHKIPRVLTTSLLVVAGVDLIFLLGTVLARTPLSRLMFGGPSVAPPEAGSLLVLAMMSVGIQQIDAVFAAAIRGLERFREQALFEVCARMVSAAVAIAAGWSTHDLRVVLLAQAGSFTVAALLRSLLVRSLIGEAVLFARPDLDLARRVLGFGGWMWLYAIATAAFTLDRVIVARLLGPAAAARFHIYVQLTWLIHYVPASIFAFLFPMFSRLNAEGGSGRASLGRLYGRSRLLIGAAALGVSLALLLLKPALLGLFAVAAFRPDSGATFAALALSYLLMSLNIAPYYLLLAVGEARIVALVACGSVAATLVLSVPLIERFGLIEAPIARFAYVLGALLLMVWAHGVVFREKNSALVSLNR
jgi:O-antigen/teichoic acid export membrane protein